MSKTDKTRPYWVKKNEYKNHFPRTSDDFPRTYRQYEWWRGEFSCSCPGLCSIGLKEKGRKIRREGKRQARDWHREY